MKTLVVEDDFTSRLLLQQLLKRYGALHIAVNGKEAVEAVRTALDAGEPYDLVCVDIMMPERDGHEALKEIRGLEESRAAHLVKPIETAKLLEQLHTFNLVQAVPWGARSFD